MSAVVALVYMIPKLMARLPWLFAVDAILFLMWVILFGIFGKVSKHTFLRSHLCSSYCYLSLLLFASTPAQLGRVVEDRARQRRWNKIQDRS